MQVDPLLPPGSLPCDVSDFGYSMGGTQLLRMGRDRVKRDKEWRKDCDDQLPKKVSKTPA